MDITAEDFKDVLFQLYVTQKQYGLAVERIQALEAQVAELTQPQEATDARTDAEAL